MALIRREAWQQVGGYTHIEGGWEDFDFWCKLVEAGFHGVQCPQILAAYRSHGSSMTELSTTRRQRPLSITLQDRHPWLQLPFAQVESY
jgi:GT2 family glycosyltransferase